MKRLLLALATFGALSTPVQAENTPVVVELFTSQGCSSCPPADALIDELAARDDVIALSLHVDYWDYIGWKDEFAVPGNAQRQRTYAAEAGRRTVYTPEMIVQGVSDIVGAKPMAVAMAIEKHKAGPRLVSVELLRAAGAVAISVEALLPDLPPMDVFVLRYQPHRTSNITRGENAGRTIVYTNVTQDWQRLGQWDGRGVLDLDVDMGGDLPVVVIVQAANHGPIIAAAQLPAQN